MFFEHMRMSPRPLEVGTRKLYGHKITEDMVSELRSALRFQQMLVNESIQVASQVIERRFKAAEVAFLVILQMK